MFIFHTHDVWSKIFGVYCSMGEFSKYSYLYPSPIPAGGGVEKGIWLYILEDQRSPRIFDSILCSRPLSQRALCMFWAFSRHHWERNSIVFYSCWPEAGILHIIHLDIATSHFKTVEKHFHMCHLLFLS